MKIKNKVAIYLMGKKGLACLNKIVECGHKDQIEFIIGARDERIQNDYYNEIQQLCVSNNIIFYDRKDKFEYTSGYVFAISWRWLIEAKNIKLIVFHDSILPKYRGFAPLVNSLINGEEKIGVTALLASDEYDRGDIIAQESIKIHYPIKIEAAINKVIPCYENLLLMLIKLLQANSFLKGERQDEKDASYSVWLEEDDYKIDWNKDSIFIKRFIDSVGYPYMGASTHSEGKKLRIIEAQIVEDVNIENRHPGKVLFQRNGKPVVICGSGLIQLDTVIEDKTGNNYLPLKKFRIKFD